MSTTFAHVASWTRAASRMMGPLSSVNPAPNEFAYASATAAARTRTASASGRRSPRRAAPAFSEARSRFASEARRARRSRRDPSLPSRMARSIAAPSGGLSTPSARLGGDGGRQRRDRRLLRALVVLERVRKPVADLLLARSVAGVRRQELDRLAVARLAHPLPEVDGLARVVARLCHQDEPDVVGFGFLRAAPGEEETVLGAEAV